MADAYSGTSALTNFVKAAYDRAAMFALREIPVFAQFARVKPGNVTNPGSSVTFTFWTDMTSATTALSETQDVDAVSLSTSTVSITPAEQGNAVITTAKVRSTAFNIGFDSDVAGLVAYNMADSVDELARAACDGGTTVDYVTGTTEVEQVAGSKVTAAKVREMHADLRTAKVRPIAGNLYAAIIHPHVSYDLKTETGDGAWIAPHQYVDTMAVYTNEMGTFAGTRFIENARAKLNTDGGSGTVDTYTTYFLGAEALGQAVSIPPHTVIGPVVDKLMRLQPIGWYGYFAFDTIREAALRRLISASGLGNNS